ncbi:hypothetical protein [Candidatus Nitrospira neomarina]|uniref:Uncharacterized protein n=1 Tax=Candidatus Nitrospira neomarina TaxID=3020899 RepID=A0AA96GTW4_9BACT|nr:hypothetical protein [Candidatus Nitrospira neomarina]WNM63994.1 hypothetical protein PQG83_09620 [Candidatus Nitrospira neomarina]
MKKQNDLAHLVRNWVGYHAMRIGLISELERSSSKYFTQGDGKRATDFIIEITKVAGGLGAKNIFVFVPEKIQVPSRTKNPLRAATSPRGRKGGESALDCSDAEVDKKLKR